MNRRRLVLVVGVATIGVALATLAWRWRKAAPVAAGDARAPASAGAEGEPPAPPPSPEAARADAGTRLIASPLPPAPAIRPTTAPARARDPARAETAIMDQLRQLSGSDPELSLRLAREGNLRFAGSAGEPERRWYIVRSLMHLSRADEARAEARVLLDRYPDSEWAQDVHRHLFVNPPTHPLERGYGKTLELE